MTMGIDLQRIRADIDRWLNSGKLTQQEARWRWEAAKKQKNIEEKTEQRKKVEERMMNPMSGLTASMMVMDEAQRLGRIDLTELGGRIYRGQFISPDNLMNVSVELSKQAVPSIDRVALENARNIIKQQNEILENLRKDALILHKVTRVSKDGKYTFVSKQGVELRVAAPEGLKVGHEVLLHPKTMGVVENLGFPPLEASPFSPNKVPDIKWDDIAGLEQAKEDLIEAIEMPHRYREMYKHYGKRPVKGLLLSGDPGCGKTMLGKAAANSLAAIYGAESAKTGFLYIKGPEILNQYVGQTEQTIREIFIDAGRHFDVHGYPAVVFIDEADAILAARGTRSVGIGNTIVPQFLTEMDGLEDSKAIVILATNRPDVLDPAIVREGRIDRKVHVSRPDIKTTIEIAKLNLRKYPICKEFELNDLAQGLAHEFFNTERFVGDDRPLKSIISGAMIAAAVDLAVASAMRRDIAELNFKEEFSGVSGDDILVAVDRIQHQNRGLAYDFNNQPGE